MKIQQIKNAIIPAVNAMHNVLSSANIQLNNIIAINKLPYDSTGIAEISKSYYFQKKCFLDPCSQQKTNRQ